MDVRELRIGNIVGHPNTPGYFRVMEIIDKCVGVGRDKVEDMLGPEEAKPVGLMTEILCACGFNKADSFDYEERWLHFGVCVVKDEGKYFNYFQASDDYYSVLGIEITSLHQLQNLYFALLGKELEINL